MNITNIYANKKNTELVGAIYNMDWIILQHETKKMLLYIMLKASDTTQMFNNAVITLSPELYLKVSFNIFLCLIISFQNF